MATPRHKILDKNIFPPTSLQKLFVAFTKAYQEKTRSLYERQQTLKFTNITFVACWETYLPGKKLIKVPFAVYAQMGIQLHNLLFTKFLIVMAFSAWQRGKKLVEICIQNLIFIFIFFKNIVQPHDQTKQSYNVLSLSYEYTSSPYIPLQ